MGKYRVTYEVDEVEFDELIKQVFASLYLAGIDAEAVRLTAIGEGLGVEGFAYPATQRLLKRLNEAPNSMADEGDWQLQNDSKVGDDLES